MRKSTFLKGQSKAVLGKSNQKVLTLATIRYIEFMVINLQPVHRSFAIFLSSEFITAIVVNSLELKQVKLTSVQCRQYYNYSPHHPI